MIADHLNRSSGSRTTALDSEGCVTGDGADPATAASDALHHQGGGIDPSGLQSCSFPLIGHRTAAAAGIAAATALAQLGIASGAGPQAATTADALNHDGC